MIKLRSGRFLPHGLLKPLTVTLALTCLACGLGGRSGADASPTPGEFRQTSLAAVSTTLPTDSQIVAKMRLVGDYFIANGAVQVQAWPTEALEAMSTKNTDWHSAVLLHGITLLKDATGDTKYDLPRKNWADRGKWRPFGNTGDGTITTHPDHLAAGLTYYDLKATVYPTADLSYFDSQMAANMRDPVNRFTWVDTAWMMMPTYVAWYTKTGNTGYLTRAFDEYHNLKERGLWNSTTKLWYRDTRFAGANAIRLSNGKELVWSRGNGWMFAALARVLPKIPTTGADHAEYLSTFRAMAAKLITLQNANDGFWRANLADGSSTAICPIKTSPSTFSGENGCANPETSGTALFVYGLARGINNGYLSSTTYKPYVAKAWNGMLTAVSTKGVLGYCQGVGDRPSAAASNESYDFCVGAFLMAGRQVQLMP
ncbi:glycoside hydrolase family 88 protein [Microbacterium deminutum]|uniref:Glycoside hydrolase family 88 protein n=1 Tax=Microbacterium deminutum TaxID=344164 RepID=A0ABP5CD32_9MICO